MKIVLIATAALLGALTLPVAGNAHVNVCHTRHTCPSDHHSYRYGPSKLLCTSYVKERRPADTVKIAVKTRRYWCSKPKAVAVVPAGSASAAAEAMGLAIERRFNPGATHRWQVALPNCTGGQGHYVCSVAADGYLSATAKVDWLSAGRPVVTFTSFVCEGVNVGRTGC